MQSRNQKQIGLLQTGADVMKTISEQVHQKNTQIADQNHDRGHNEFQTLARQEHERKKQIADQNHDQGKTQAGIEANLQGQRLRNTMPKTPIGGNE